jgi:hypothetical protein
MAVAALVAACGGNTTRVVGDRMGSSSTGANGGAGGSATDLGGTGGTTVVAGTPNANLTPTGFPRCGELDPTRADDCAKIELITLMDPRVSSSVDGGLETHEGGPVDVWVKNGDTIEHNDVCVGVTVDNPGVTLSPYQNASPTRVGIMAPGGIFIVTAGYFAVDQVDPGTTVRFTTWTTYQGTNCIGPIATIDALVKAYPH